jgi:death-on-curing protein
VAGTPNPGLVESAIGRPYNGHYRSIEKKCAALVESISRNHGFADGNKRTAVILLHTLVTRSGYRLCPGTKHENLDAAIEQMVIDVVTKVLTFSELVAWLRARIRKR